MKDWQVHKIFCKLHPFQAKTPTKYRSVQAILLPEKDKAPLVVHVPMKSYLDEDTGCTYLLPQVEQFLGDTMQDQIRSDYLPQRPFAHLPHTIHLKFREALDLQRMLAFLTFWAMSFRHPCGEEPC